MVEVVAGQALADALVGITTEMTGQTLTEAWSSQGFSDPEKHIIDYTTGSIESVTYRARSIQNGVDKPAISGDTTGTVDESLDSDPIDAFEEWSESNPGSVDSITGGAVLGSKVQTYAYSLFRTLDPDTQQELIKAVVPIAVPAEMAYPAISQLLGVSMNVPEMPAELITAFLEAEKEYQYTEALAEAEVYTNFVAAWWDGVNILFPRKAIEAVEDCINAYGLKAPRAEEFAQGTYTTGGMTVADVFATIKLVPGAEVTGLEEYGSYTGASAWQDQQYYSPAGWGTYGGVGRVIISESSVYAEGVYILCFNGPDGAIKVTIRNGGAALPNNSHISAGPNPYTPTPGVVSSSAPSYTSSSVPSAGGVATSPSNTIDTVAVQLYDDPYNTIGQTSDPNAPTDQDIVGSLPESPPMELPVPSTIPSNPDLSLDDSSVVDQTKVELASKALEESIRTNPPQSTGVIGFPELPNIGGTFPSIVPSSGPGLIHVYNPTPQEFINFGRWLWVTYADATIDKIWNNPFDGIVGAFELYATPQTSGRDNIYSGFLTCPTTSKIVPQRYFEIDCGTVVVPEFYGNYFDYSPYSQCYIYLPFIGINEVSIDDIVGHAVNIRYRVDSYNGSCIAMIYVAKEGYRNLCYQFAGNCAVEVPLAGGSQASIKAGVLQAEAYARASQISGVVGGISSALMGGATGGLGGFLMGAASGITSGVSAYTNAQAGLESAKVANKSSVQHSGQFGASHGAMGAKKPFIIIRNPIQVKVVNYNEEYGFSAHKRVIIGACKGYLRVREVNVISAHATNAEKTAIENALKAGVYVE